MSPSLPFLRIPKTAQLVVVTDLEQESFPVIHLKKLFPGRDFVVVSPRDFKIGDWKKADKNFEGFIYLLNFRSSIIALFLSTMLGDYLQNR